MKKNYFFILLFLIGLTTYTNAQAPCHQFAPAVNYGVGFLPNFVSTGDFNSDGTQDLAIANWGNDNVSVLLGTGTGVFNPQTTYSAGAAARSVVVGDFNGDGHLDLATANANDNNVSVLIGAGNGIFAPQVTYSVDSLPVFIVTHDFNGDGYLDLVTVNSRDNNISILLGNGDGTFASQVTYPVGIDPRSVALGDFNKDGNIDLAVVNRMDNTLSILTGVGDGTFNSAVSYSGIGLNPMSIATGDFDGDGNLDLAITYDGGNVVSVLLGTTSGVFSNPPVSYNAGSGAFFVAIGDLDEDGNLDLVTANTSDNTISILSGNGDGTFGVADTYGVGSSPIAVIVKDLNSDGHLDLVTVNITGSSATVILQEPIIHYDTISPIACDSYTSPSGAYTWNVSGTYWDTIPTTMGCDSALIIHLTIHNSPIVDLGLDTTICAGDSFVLDAENAGATYEWNDFSTGQTLVVNTAGVYNVKVTDANNCTTSDTIEVFENVLPIVNLGLDTSYCQGTTFNLVLDAENAGATYAWNDFSTGQTLAVNTAGTYSVEVTDANNCVASDTIEITENTLPIVDLGLDTTICAGDSFILDAENAGATYEWNDFSTGQTLIVNAAGVYNVKVTDANNCVASDAVEVFENALPIVNLGLDTSYCQGTTFSLVLDAENVGATYEWNDFSTGQTLAVNSAGTYSVEVTDGNNCIASDTIEITENTLPIVNLGLDTSYCQGTTFSLVLDAENAGATYEWNDSSTGQTLAINTAGVYNVKVTDANNCVAFDTIEITENALPIVDLGLDDSYCQGTTFSLVLDAENAGATYAWNDFSTGQTLAVNTAGTYSVEVTDGNNCTASDTIEITENALPIVHLGLDTSYCQGTTFNLVLDAENVGATYEWNDFSTGQTLAVNSAGIYSVEVTDGNNCVGSDAIEILENTLPIVDLGLDTTICAGDSFVLDAENAGATYEWNDFSTGQTLAVNTAGVYNVKVTDANNCVASDIIEVFENALPIVNLGLDTSYCQGTTFSLVLDAENAGATYEWNDFSTGQTLAVNNAGIYSVEVTDANNCVASDTIEIIENTLPIVHLGANIIYCQNENFSTILNAQNTGSTYEWSDNSTGQTLVVDTAGVYFVEVTNINNCVGSDTITIIENLPPIVSANASDTVICAGSAVVLTGSGATSYVWNNNAIDGEAAFPTDTTTYTVIGTNMYNCADTAFITIHVKPSIQLEFINPSPLCEGDDFVLPDTSVNAISGTWSPSVFDNTQTMSYTFTPDVDSTKCIMSETIEIVVNKKPIVDLGEDIFSCNSNFSIVLDAENVGSTYLWSDSTTNQTLETNGFGTYSVFVTSAFNCSDTGTITISAGDTMLVTGDIQAEMKTQCLFDFYVEDANAVEVFTWSFGTITQQDTAVSHTISGYGKHEIIVTMNNACDTITKSIVVSCNPDFILYPNPASTDVTIENHLGIIMDKIVIIDNTGKVVFIVEPNATTINFDISHLANAFYTVRIETGQGRVIKKLEVMK